MEMEATIRVWLLQVIAMMITALLIPRLRITSLLGAGLIVIALAAVNATIWSADIFGSMPQSATYETAVTLVANGAIFWILTKLLPGIEVRGILPALVAPLVFTLVGALINQYAADVDLSEVAGRVLDSVVRLREWLLGAAPDGKA